MLRHCFAFLFGMLFRCTHLARWRPWHPNDFVASQPAAASPVVPKGTND